MERSLAEGSSGGGLIPSVHGSINHSSSPGLGHPGFSTDTRHGIYDPLKIEMRRLNSGGRLTTDQPNKKRRSGTKLRAQDKFARSISESQRGHGQRDHMVNDINRLVINARSNREKIRDSRRAADQVKLETSRSVLRNRLNCPGEVRIIPPTPTSVATYHNGNALPRKFAYPLVPLSSMADANGSLPASLPDGMQFVMVPNGIGGLELMGAGQSGTAIMISGLANSPDIFARGEARAGAATSGGMMPSNTLDILRASSSRSGRSSVDSSFTNHIRPASQYSPSSASNISKQGEHFTGAEYIGYSILDEVQREGSREPSPRHNLHHNLHHNRAGLGHNISLNSISQGFYDPSSRRSTPGNGLQNSGSHSEINKLHSTLPMRSLSVTDLVN